VIAGFSAGKTARGGVDIAYSIGGRGPPLVLLHGFPQTRVMWSHVAPKLAEHRTVICPDLRGYGMSGTPEGTAPYTFREMAGDIRYLVAELGYETFDLAGHDRGARVAHRLCLDAPGAVRRVALMDIVPTYTLLSDLRREVAEAYYHWFFLAQPSPLPERMIGAGPDAYFEACLAGWGGGTEGFDPALMQAYRAAWRRPETIRAMCADYRAALHLDFADDAASLDARITCPALVLWGADGVMARWYDVAGVWAGFCSDMRGAAMPGGHFFVDTHGAETVEVLDQFFD